MHLRALDYVLWLACPCLQVGILVAMRKRGSDSEFPFFYAYTIWQVVSVAYLVCAERISYAAYYYSYWVVTLLSVVMAFALIDELFRHAFRHFAALRDFGRIIFRWAVIVVLLAACAGALSSHHLPGFDRVSEIILIADRSARAMLCALVILLLLGSRYLLLSRRTLLFGIALGFAVFTFTKVIIDSILLAKPSLSPLLNRVNSVAYIVTCMVWLAYAVRAEESIVAAATPLTAAVPALAGPPLLPVNTLLDTINSLVEQSLREHKETT
jgi:hypothetical protein